MASIQVEVDRFVNETHALENLLSETGSLPPRQRKLIAELILIKLAVGFENCISQGIYRLAAGQPDLAGQTVTRHSNPQTISSARSALLTGVRGAPWLNASDMCSCLLNVVPPTEPLLQRIRQHGVTVTTIRKVRNHIAHRNSNSSIKFREVVRQVYGAPLNHISPGTLLLTHRSGPRSLCLQLLIAGRVAASEIFQK